MSWPPRSGRSPAVAVSVPAWALTEGSELPAPDGGDPSGRVSVLLVDRDPVSRKVQVLTDAPGAVRTEHAAADLIDVVSWFH